jgi:hypothetical protein
MPTTKWEKQSRGQNALNEIHHINSCTHLFFLAVQFANYVYVVKTFTFIFYRFRKTKRKIFKAYSQWVVHI